MIVNRVGTAGKDKLKGTKKKDGMLGLGGNDKLKGKKGKDGLCGGKGKDKLIGGPARTSSTAVRARTRRFRVGNAHQLRAGDLLVDRPRDHRPG